MAADFIFVPTTIPFGTKKGQDKTLYGKIVDPNTGAGLDVTGDTIVMEIHKLGSRIDATEANSGTRVVLGGAAENVAATLDTAADGYISFDCTDALMTLASTRGYQYFIKWTEAGGDINWFSGGTFHYN